MQKPNLFKFFFYLCIGIAIYMGLIQLLLEFELNCADCNSEDIKIHNWPDALWYTTVTLTTVGYGDMTPISTGGRIIGTVFILFSVGLYGLLIGQVATILNSVKENRRLGMNGTIFTEHVVIIGWTDFGKAVTDQLVAAGREVAIVTSEKDNIDIIREFYPQKKVFTLFSDYNNFDSLSKLNIDKSYIVFVNLNDDTEKLVYILNLKKSYENLSYIVTLDNANLKNTFITAGVTYAISKHEIASKLLASYIFEPDVAVLSEDIMSYAENDEDQDLKQFKILHNNDYIGSLYQDVFFDLKKKTNAVLLGIVKKEDGNRKLYKNPQIDLFIKEGDYLIIICNKESEIKISEKFHIKEGRHK